MDPILYFVAMASLSGWTLTPDGQMASMVQGSHVATLSCGSHAFLRLDLDAPEGTDAVILETPEVALNIRGTTESGRFVAYLQRDGLPSLALRGRGTLRIGGGTDGFELPWTPAGSAVDALAQGCGNGA